MRIKLSNDDVNGVTVVEISHGSYMDGKCVTRIETVEHIVIELPPGIGQDGYEITQGA